ncbi:serine/arginine repetitive matrix protein 2-like [Watersipora subatra]|uniref:serine/arginine repetitive matrix protein 2-like n=1 Tax=Watersipora subatra TaxID=2589382 RepID=UPI00355BAB60
MADMSKIPLHDILNTSDHLLDISSEHESLTHHPSLTSAYESELQFDESTLQHETEPYHSQVEDNAEQETSAENFNTQSDRGDNSQVQSERGDNSRMGLEDIRVYSSSPRAAAGEDVLEESEEEEEGDNPYSSYQQFHRDLSSHEDPKSELMEFELLEQEMGIGSHKSRREKWADNSTSDLTSFSTHSKSKRGHSSPSRIPRVPGSQSPSGRPLTSNVTQSRSRSMTPTGIPVLRSRSQASPRERSPSANRGNSVDVPASGRRSVSADTNKSATGLGRSGVPPPKPTMSPGTKRRNLSTSQLPRSRPLTPSSSIRSFDRQSSEEMRSEVSEVTSTSRPPSRLPIRSKSGTAQGNPNLSRASVEPRLLQKNSSKPSRLPSARPSVTSATELTSQDEQSPGLDLSSGDEMNANPSDPMLNTATFITPPHNSFNFRNPPSSDTQPFSTQADTQEQFTSMDEKSSTDAPQTPKIKTTTITQRTYDYEEVETTKRTTRILSQPSPPASEEVIKGEKDRSKNSARLKRVENLMDRQLTGFDRKDSPSQFGEAKALNDAIKLLEARETKENKSSTEKSSWSPSMPDDMGDNSRPSSTWTSLADYNADDTKASTAAPRAEELVYAKPSQKRKGEDMPRTNHTHLPGAVNHAHYALPTTSYLHKLQDGERDSSSSELPRKSPRKKKYEMLSAQQPDHPPKETESQELVKQLQTDFDDLLSKYAMAEVTIDQLRLGAKLNMYADPAQPSQATVVQPGTARSATTLSLPQKGQVSLNSSLQSTNMAYNLPGSSPRQLADAGILTTGSPKPLTDSQRSIQDNIIHLQDQVASFIAGVSGEGRLLNLKPEVHHQLYEALEQSQDTLHHQLNEEKRNDPSFDEENQLAGQLHQIRMAMDEHLDRLPQVPQQHPYGPVKYNSDEETRSNTPSSLASGSTSTQRPKRGNDKRSKRGSRKTPSLASERSSSPGEEIMTDDDTIRPRSHRVSPSKGLHAASASSIAGSDQGQPRVKSSARLQGSSDSGFIGSEEGKSPNTPTDKHHSGLPTIQSQAENSGLDSPRALTPDLSESRTAEWALRHKVPLDHGSVPVLPEPKKRTLSRSSRKSVRSERSGQSSLRSEALRSIQSEIEKLRDDFQSQQAMRSPDRDQTTSPPKHTYGSPMKATYQLPAGYKQPSVPKPSPNKADVRNSDLDLSEVEGGRGYAPAPQTNRRGGNPHEYYPSTDEDPRIPLAHSDERKRGDQKPFLDKQYLEHSPRKTRDPEYSTRQPDNRPLKSEYSGPEATSRPRGEVAKHSDTESNARREEMPGRTYGDSRRQRDSRQYRSSPVERNVGKEYSPGRSPAPQYNYDSRPYYRSEDPRVRDRPSSGRSLRSNDDVDYQRGPRWGYREEMSPISERPYEEPASEYYRKYKSPLRRSRSFQDMRAPPRDTLTMDELNTRDLQQTTLYPDSTVYTHQAKSPNLAPPNAYSTPHHQQSHISQSQPPRQPSHQSGQPYQTQEMYHSSHMPNQQSYPQAVQNASMPHNSHLQPMTSAPDRPPIPQHSTMPAAPSNIPATTATYQTCTSCAGRGVLATAHHCTLCGTQVQQAQNVQQAHNVQLVNQLSNLRLTNQQPTHMLVTNQTSTPVVLANQTTTPVVLSNQSSTPVVLANQATIPVVLTKQVTEPVVVANQNAAVVIPVSNEKKAYLTQQTSEGYLTQGVNVLETAETRAEIAVPVHGPEAGVRYYVRDYGVIHSDSEPGRSRSHRKKGRRRHSPARASMDDLETSLRDARRSAESLKRLSRGMRDELQDELTRSLHRRSLNHSWLF